MLGFLFNTSDHPLASEREATRLLGELVKREPLDAVDESGAWVESLLAAEDIKWPVKAARVLKVDEAVMPLMRRLGRDYLAQARANRQAERRLWDVCHAYWVELSTAYDRVLAQIAADKKTAEDLASERCLLTMRALHAHANRLKWDQFRYGPISPAFWSTLGALFLASEQEKRLQKALPLYPGTAPTTARDEYLKALLFHASAMDKLLPVEIELAERLIAHFLASFTLTRELRPDNAYWVDVSKALPPTRLARVPDPTPTLYFFNGSAALAGITIMQVRIEADNRLPADLNLGGQYEPSQVIPVLAHLAACWSPQPPIRKESRHQFKTRLSVVHGLADAIACLGGRLGDNDKVEAWVADDVSLGGVGAQVPLRPSDWIGIDTLVAMQPEGGDNWLLGVVRRFVRSTQDNGQVGIETISKAPRMVSADMGGLATDAILLDVPVVGAYARMVLPLDAQDDQMAITFDLDGKRARLFPTEPLDVGADFLIVRFFVQSL